MSPCKPEGATQAAQVTGSVAETFVQLVGNHQGGHSVKYIYGLRFRFLVNLMVHLVKMPGVSGVGGREREREVFLLARKLRDPPQ